VIQHARSSPRAASVLKDAELMASILEAQHGAWAEEVAHFFAQFHGQQGDLKRAKAWAGVVAAVRTRELTRMLEAS
jgi:hypothetical protein